jgi:hypothetical protein
MKIFTGIICYIFFLGLFSCEKDNNPEIPASFLNYAVCGLYDTAYKYKLLIPSLSIEEKESGCLVFKGRDSLDLDDDLQFDVAFESGTFIPDLSGICCDCPDDPEIICDCWPYGREYMISYVLDSSFQIAISNNYKISCFTEGDTIDNTLSWENKSTLTFKDIQNFPPPPLVTGNWIYDDNRYLGIRKIETDTIYGWIKISISPNIDIKEIFIGMKD